jgi:hypothetical protein
MINNVDKIRTMMSFTDKDDFYFLQILKRRKDNPDMERDMVVIDNVYIDSLESYDRKIPHIIDLCDVENARAYFRVNKRNYAKLGPHMLKRVVDIVFTENCKSLRSAFDSVAGEFHSDKDKKWVVDVDYKDFKGEASFLEEVNLVTGTSPTGRIISALQALQLAAKREPMLEIIPTKNGVHIITRPFNLQVFKEHYPFMDVHKDNPTILYCP